MNISRAIEADVSKDDLEYIDGQELQKEGFEDKNVLFIKKVLKSSI